MSKSLLRLALLVAVAGIVTACADKSVTLRYQPDPALEPLANAGSLAVFRFTDQRGSEGDQDPFRVGGVYGGYGNRLSKVMTDTPWQRTLAHAIADGFKARGVQAVAEDREYSPGVSFTTPFALGGEVRNFSTESRWSTSAHISAAVRIYDAKGAILVEKRISDRETWGLGAGILMSEEPLEDTLDRALAGFVRKIVLDPDISSALSSQGR
jgi:hypothetical protein